MSKRKHSSVSKRLARVERELKQDKPEVKTLDVLLNPLTSTGSQAIYSTGINVGTPAVPVFGNYDLTRGFIQGLQNTGGNIDGNYCKLTSMDLRIYLKNSRTAAKAAAIRLMVVRVPAAEQLTPADIQTQVLEYGAPSTYGELSNVSPLKRNSTINGGYDVMYDRVHTLSLDTENPVRSTKYIHFRKKWTKGMTLRFSGVAGALSLEQNRIYLFAMDALNPFSGPDTGVLLSFINRVRYSDE